MRGCLLKSLPWNRTRTRHIRESESESVFYGSLTEKVSDLRRVVAEEGCDCVSDCDCVFLCCEIVSDCDCVCFGLCWEDLVFHCGISHHQSYSWPLRRAAHRLRTAARRLPCKLSELLSCRKTGQIWPKDCAVRCRCA